MSKNLRFPLSIQLFAETENDDDESTIEDEKVDEELTPSDISGGDEDEDADGKSETKDDGKSEVTKKAKPNRQYNAYQAKLRREREERERKKELEKAYLKGKLEGIKTNPYTEEPIQDSEDLEVYEIMRELDEQGKSPIEDFPKEVARRRRELNAKKQKEQEDKQKQDDFIRQDYAQFSKKYADVNLNTLFNDESFKLFSNSRLGKDSLSDIYNDYLNFCNVVTKRYESKKAEEEKAKQDKEQAKQMGKTPAPSQTPGTTKEYKDLSREEKRRILIKEGYL